MAEILYIVVPCYNEREVLAETAARLARKLAALVAAGTVSVASRILFVDDGSRDSTWEIIEGLHTANPVFCGVKLSRNRGHQNALLAGLHTAAERADIIISMDADLQDDIDTVDAFLARYNEGCDVVYGVRSARKRDTLFKRTTAQAYYKLLKLLGADIVYNHADYRLMSKRAVEGLRQFGEVNLFLRGLVPLVGYRSATVEYERAERFAGTSKYPLKKMIAFALDGITSLSAKPLRFITGIGFLIIAASLAALLYIWVRKLGGHTEAGWATLMGSVWFLGGLQLFAIGIVGEYVGKTYNEVKHRPTYLIEKDLEREFKI